MTATIRAIAENNELEVSFGGKASDANTPSVRVPLPVIGCSEHELNALRGMGDEIALRVRHHDASIHRRNTPASGSAQELFQWVEDARVASIGTLRMEGVAQNLDAHLESICRQSSFDQIIAKTEAPLGVAVGLIVRQRLTGRELPPSAENVARFWREYVENRATEHINQLEECIYDQQLFAKRCKNILASLGLVPELDEPRELGSQDQKLESGSDAEEPDDECAAQNIVLDEDSCGHDDYEGDTTTVKIDADMDLTDLDSDPERETTLSASIDDQGQIRVDIGYEMFATEFDEIIRADELCDTEEMSCLRSLLDQQLTHIPSTPLPSWQTDYSIGC